MVSVEELCVLDALLWLGRGSEVSARLNINQSTVSRKAAAAARAFDMVLQRNSDGWHLLGDPFLLRLERHVHQAQRIRKICGLRLDADPWLGPVLLPSPTLGPWIMGCYHYLAHHQPLRLLRERVLDGWLTVLKGEIVTGNCSELAIIDLGSMPMQLMSGKDHPLVGEAKLDMADLLRFPRLNLPSGVVPVLEAVIRDSGLWDSPVLTHFYCPEDWEGKAVDQAALVYGHPLLTDLNPAMRPLDYSLGATYPIALVVHRDLADHPATEALVASLIQKLKAKQARYPELVLAG